VFAEAMAMKRPVVALNNGGTAEVVEHGTCGLLSAPGDIDALAANDQLRPKIRVAQ
jgi:glycosyltransferase involved in cell wall biosynthesis